MKLHKEEVKLQNGFNQFNLVDENNLIVGVVAGFTPEQNLKNATLFENATQLLEALQDLVRFCEDNNTGAELELALDVLEKLK